MRVLIIDDHPLIQDAVSNVVRRLDPDAQIVTASACERGLEIASRDERLDLVLLDLALPGLSGIPALKRWRSRLPAVPVVILSASSEPSVVLSAIDAGAAGFVPKSSSNEVMENALRLVMAGGRYLPPEILGKRGIGLASERNATPSPATLGLTERQVQVLGWLVRGASNKVICRELDLAERTVKAHVTAVLRALKVSSRTQAALEAARLGLLDLAHDEVTDRSSGGVD